MIGNPGESDQDVRMTWAGERSEQPRSFLSPESYRAEQNLQSWLSAALAFPDDLRN
jgi:hypothetical protein